MHKQHAQAKIPDSNIGRRINSILFYALLLLIVLSPIPLGSNRNWSWSLCALIVSLLTLAWVVNTLWNQRTISASVPGWIVILFLLPVLWAMFQATSLMPEAWTHPLWSLSGEMLGSPIPTTISLTPDNTLIAVMRLMSYGLMFFLSFQYCRNPHRAHSMLKWLAISGILYALYGLIIYWGNFNILFWIESTETVNTTVTSTFINRNSYVTYAGLGLLCLMALSLANFSRGAGSPYGSLMGRQETFEYYIFISWKPLLGLMLLTTALISTQSRGGFISAGPAVLVLLFIYIARMRLNTTMLLSSIGGVFVIILLAFSVSNDPLLERLGKIQTGGGERGRVYELTIDATKDAPLAGFGYGSYYEGFRMYRNADINNIYDKAHNTYLENSFELGVPAMVSLLLAMFGLTLITLRGVIQRRRDWLYPATGVAASVLVGIHSLVDFSLQIPAIAITYAAIMGLAVAQSYSSAKPPP